MRLYSTTALALVAAALHSPAGAQAPQGSGVQASAPQAAASPLVAPTVATVSEVKGKAFLHVDARPVKLSDYIAARAKGPLKEIPVNLIRRKLPDSQGKRAATATADTEATAAAQSYRAGDTTAAEPPTDIDALARALKYDPDLIYEFVRDNIEITPVYGIQKGAWGALIDRSGSNFDQIELFVRLLRASGYQADYLLGVIQLSGAQVQDYFGISTSNTLAVVDHFSAGQTPSEFYFTGTSSTNPLDYALLQHMWARVTINGQQYMFDPSLKSHVVKSGIGVAAAAGYNQSTYLANAKAGATVTANSARNLNRGNVRGGLASYATNLITSIRANTPAAALDDIVGGKSIARNLQLTAAPTRNANLPVARMDYGGNIFTGEIPVDFRSIVQVVFNGVNVAFLADDFYGARLTVTPNANNEMQLMADGEVIATGSQLPVGYSQGLQVGIQHLAYSTINADQTIGRPMYGGETFAISYALGTSTNRLSKLYREQAVAASAAGSADSSEAVLGAELAALGADLNAQMGMSVYLTDRAANANTQLHHTLGLVTQHDGAPNVNFTMSNTVVQQDRNESRRLAAVISHTMHGSALESGVLEQTLKVPAASTIHFIDKAVKDGETIYNATAANFDSEVVPNLTGCSSAEIAGLRTFIDANWRLVLPNNCRQVEGDWVGSGAMELSPDPNDLSIGMQISGGYNGGFSSRRTVSLVPSQIDRKRPDLKDPKKLRGDPIDMATGAFTYSHDDLVVGRGDYPEALSLTKSYRSSAALFDGPLGRGWSFNHAMLVRPVTDAYQGLGEDSPIDAAGSIVDAMVTIDLLSDPQLPFDKLAVAMLGQRWWVDQLNDNAVKVSTDVEGSTFVKLPDGTYNSPSDNSSKLIRNADGTFTQSLVDKTVYQFDASGNVVVRKQPNGVEVHFAYTDGKLTSVQNSFGRSLTLAYDGNHISSVQDGTGRSVSYSYDAAGNLASFTDAAGKTTTFEYDQPGRMSKFYLPANPTVPQVSNVYDTLGRISRQTDADDKVWNYFIAGTRSEQVSPLGNRAADYFDGEGRVIATLEDLNSPSGTNGYWEPHASYFEFDGLGRLSQSTDSFGPMVQLTYDDASCNGAERRCTNNVKVRVKKAIHKAGDTTTLPDETQTFTYEPQFNKVLTATNARGKTTNYSYDAAGNLTSIVSPPAVDGGTLRPTTTIGYTSFSGAAGFPALTLPTSITKNIDATNSVTNSVTYDAANALVPKTSVVDSDGLNLTTAYGYDAVGNLTTVDGPRTDVLDVTTLVYDAERRVTDAIDALGKVTRTNFNPDGDVTSVARQLGSQWLATCYSRLPSGKIARVVGPANVDTSDACPAAAAPNKITDVAYDGEGRVLTKTVNLAALEGGNRVTQYGYTPSGDLISTMSAAGTSLEQMTARGRRTYTSAWSSMGWFSARNSGAIQNSAPSVLLEYDAHGRQTKTEFRLGDGSGIGCPVLTGGYGCEQYAYDTAGNLTSWTRRDGQALTFIYDNLNRVTQRPAKSAADSVSYSYDLLGRMLSATTGGKAGASVAYSYDKAGRVLSSTSGGRTVSYQYDAAGNRVRTTWPDTSFSVTYDYDALNRVSAIKENAANLLASYAYDDLSRRTGVTYGNGTSIAYGYDSQAQLSSQSYDLAGTNADLTRTFARDQAGEITGLTTSNPAYDWNGYYDVNRPYTTDVEERYLTSGSKALTYGDRGNLAGDGTWKFTYDVLNRLTSAVVKNATSLTYGYDPIDRLSSRQSGRKSVVNYLYDGDQLIGEYDANGLLIRRYVPGPGTDDALMVYDGLNAASKTWLYPDERGSVTAAADASGNAVATMSYGPFGEPNVNTGVSLRYTGQMLDPESGLYYYKARWYSPYLGRFLSPDPALFVDGLQTYTYVGNDPVNFSDPLGLNKQEPERCDESTTFALNTVGTGTQLLGDSATLVGVGVAGTGIGAGAGAGIAIGGKVISGAGTLIKLGGAYCEGHLLSSAAGEILGWAAGTGANKVVNKVNKGPWIDEASKRFAKNPLGGPFRDVKTEGISKVVEHGVSNAVEAIGEIFQ